jgi:hypothetical protein
MTVGVVAFEAEKRDAAVALGGDHVENLGVLRDVLGVQTEARRDVGLQPTVRIAGGAEMPVRDARSSECRRQRRFAEPLATGQW